MVHSGQVKCTGSVVYHSYLRAYLFFIAQIGVASLSALSVFLFFSPPRYRYHRLWYDFLHPIHILQCTIVDYSNTISNYQLVFHYVSVLKPSHFIFISAYQTMRSSFLLVIIVQL